MPITPYLFFNGNCLEAMTHYADVLGGTVVGVVRNSDAPDPQSRMPGGDDQILNMGITIDGGLVMASDAGGMYSEPQGFAISFDAPSLAEFDRIHAALAKDARAVAMAPAETFWADRFAMFTDRYGTPWMLGFAGSKREQ